jgi:flagellar motility protein MotE (MotC chaperone)
MIAKLQNPLTAMVFSLVVSITLGTVLCWRAATPWLELAAAARPKPAADKKEKGWDFWTIEIENLSTDLKEERARLRQQADLQDQRAARLAAEARELGKIRADIEGLRREIADKVIEITADEAKNLRTLAQTYANLSPRAAVAILRELDDLTAVKILSLMKPDVVGPIFEEMSRTAGTDGPLARRAAVLSEKLRLMKAGKPPSPT